MDKGLHREGGKVLCADLSEKTAKETAVEFAAADEVAAWRGADVSFSVEADAMADAVASRGEG
ncbi:hypothetical protein [Streptomyces lutosisoli]|uniref:Uncharacterized protein n=1 Tax=Streptomyces lutosisoli TaxID=2665721 RepID=A0ABW2VY42_9ACTN